VKLLIGLIQAILALFGGSKTQAPQVDWYAALQDARIPELIAADKAEEAAKIYAAITEGTPEQGKQVVDLIREQLK